MASGPPANHLQDGDDYLQVPSWSGAVILGRGVQPGLVCRRQVAAAVGKQRGTRCAAHKDHDRSEERCCGWPGHLEQPPRRPADFIAVQRYICEKNLKLIYLAASALEVFSNWTLYKLTYSFRHKAQRRSETVFDSFGPISVFVVVVVMVLLIATIGVVYSCI